MVKRYDLFVEKNEIREFHNGDYVSFTDYEMLDIEREALAERCERLQAALRALVDYDSEAHNDTSLLDNGPLWDQAYAALSEKSQ